MSKPWIPREGQRTCRVCAFTLSAKGAYKLSFGEKGCRRREAKEKSATSARGRNKLMASIRCPRGPILCSTSFWGRDGEPVAQALGALRLDDGFGYAQKRVRRSICRRCSRASQPSGHLRFGRPASRLGLANSGWSRSHARWTTSVRGQKRIESSPTRN